MRRLLVLVALVYGLDAHAVTIDWVPVGNLGNTADTPANCLGSPADCGSVDHAYYISQHETTNAQYAEFLNAVDADGGNALALYNGSMGSDAGNGGIDFVSGNPSGSKYVVKPGFVNKPVTYVSFYDALRFANWLNNGKGIGDTETGAYTVTAGGITANSITRNPSAITFLTSENEWYKAAYYSPGGVYYEYPAGDDAPTTCAIPGATPNTANCLPDGPDAVTNVGAYTGSASPYGTFDQGGNVWEWNEATYDPGRGLRGGDFGSLAGSLAASIPYYNFVVPSFEARYLGFRVASLVPEPGPGLLGMTAVLGLAACRRRRAS
jgi:formylglycine-generating enzyme required for sulfatase activity